MSKFECPNVQNDFGFYSVGVGVFVGFSVVVGADLVGVGVNLDTVGVMLFLLVGSGVGNRSERTSTRSAENRFSSFLSGYETI